MKKYRGRIGCYLSGISPFCILDVITNVHIIINRVVYMKLMNANGNVVKWFGSIAQYVVIANFEKSIISFVYKRNAELQGKQHIYWYKCKTVDIINKIKGILLYEKI